MINELQEKKIITLNQLKDFNWRIEQENKVIETDLLMKILIKNIYLYKIK
jgi:hypothetical protein